MDLLEKGKQLTQQGKYEEALDALYLALENDKENADVHFYIGLCYSSLEEFGYAKFHYQTALSLNPEHAKSKLVWEGIKNYEAERPSERSKTRAAAARARRANPKEGTEAVPHEPDLSASQKGIPTLEEDDRYSNYKVTDERWEKAFPVEDLDQHPEKMGVGIKITLILIALVILGLVAFFVYDTFALL